MNTTLGPRIFCFMKESVQDRPAAVCVADRPTARERAGTAAKESAESGTRRGAYLRREYRRDLLSLLRQPDGRAQCQLNLLTLPAARPTFLLHKKAPAESLLSFPCGCMIIRRGFPRFFYAAFLSFGRRIFRMMATKAAGTMPEPPKIN